MCNRSLVNYILIIQIIYALVYKYKVIKRYHILKLVLWLALSNSLELSFNVTSSETVSFSKAAVPVSIVHTLGYPSHFGLHYTLLFVMISFI